MTAAPAPDAEPHDPSEPVPRGGSRRGSLALVAGAVLVALGLGACGGPPKPVVLDGRDRTRGEVRQPDPSERPRETSEPVAAAPAAPPKVGCPPLREPGPDAAVSAEDRATFRAISRWIAYDAPQVQSWLYRMQLPGMHDGTAESMAIELHLRMCLGEGRPTDLGAARNLFQERLVDVYPHSAWEASVREDLANFPRPFQVDTRLVTAPPPLALTPLAPVPPEEPPP